MFEWTATVTEVVAVVQPLLDMLWEIDDVVLTSKMNHNPAMVKVQLDIDAVQCSSTAVIEVIPTSVTTTPVCTVPVTPQIHFLWV